MSRTQCLLFCICLYWLCFNFILFDCMLNNQTTVINKNEMGRKCHEGIKCLIYIGWMKKSNSNTHLMKIQIQIRIRRSAQENGQKGIRIRNIETLTMKQATISEQQNSNTEYWFFILDEWISEFSFGHFNALHYILHRSLKMYKKTCYSFLCYFLTSNSFGSRIPFQTWTSINEYHAFVFFFYLLKQK